MKNKKEIKNNGSPTKFKSGFSLIEVVVTVTIIVILSIISGPIYRSYSDKATMSEGYALLGTIRSAQEAYYNDTGWFMMDGYVNPGGFSGNPLRVAEVFGIDARHNRYYTAFLVGTNYNDGTTNRTYSNYTVGFCAQAFGPNTLSMVYSLTTGVTMFE